MALLCISSYLLGKYCKPNCRIILQNVLPFYSSVNVIHIIHFQCEEKMFCCSLYKMGMYFRMEWFFLWNPRGKKWPFVIVLCVLRNTRIEYPSISHSRQNMVFIYANIKHFSHCDLFLVIHAHHYLSEFMRAKFSLHLHHYLL